MFNHMYAETELWVQSLKMSYDIAKLTYYKKNHVSMNDWDVQN